MAKEPIRTIPDSVLALLRHRWRLPEAGYSAFTSAFAPPFEPWGNVPDISEDEARSRHAAYARERQLDPSCYYIPRDMTEAQRRLGGNLLSYAEAAALIRDTVFGNGADDEGSRVVINEHAQHALDDFCQEVYGAWAKYLDRLKLIERACPSIARLRAAYGKAATTHPDLDASSHRALVTTTEETTP